MTYGDVTNVTVGGFLIWTAPDIMVQQLQNFEPGEVEVMKSPPNDEVDIDTPARAGIDARLCPLRHYFFPAM